MTHRKGRIAPLFHVIALVVVLAAPAQIASAEPNAGTLYVAPAAQCSGASPCFATIQEAVDAAQAGDTVKVSAGVYTAPGVQVVRITKALTLLGGYAAGDWSNANPQANASIIDAQNQVGRRGIVAEGTIFVPVVVTIDGFTVRNGNNAPPQACGGICGLFVNAQIRNNTVISNTGGGIHVAGTVSSTYALIERNNVAYTREDIFNNNGGGIVIEDALGVVQNNTSQFNTGRGLLSFKGADTRAFNNLFSNNTSGGITSSTSRNLWLDGNTVTNNGSYGFNSQFLFGQPAYNGVYTITNNTFRDNTLAGMNFSQAVQASGEVRGNTIAGNGFYGVFAGIADGVAITFTNNVITGNTTGGVKLDAQSGSVTQWLTNTIQSNKGSGVVVEGGRNAIVVLAGNRIEDNKVANAFNTDGGGGIRVEGGNVSIARNRIARNVVNGYGGGIFVDGSSNPLFLTQVMLNANQILTNTSKGLGSGFALGGGVVTATNDVIARNFAELPAVYVFSGTLSAAHWTLANNGSYGVRVFYGGQALIHNTIIAGHSVAGFEQSAGGALVADTILSWNNGAACANGALCSNVITGDPKFLSDRMMSYHIQAGSAAIDQALDLSVTDDMDGLGRPHGAAPDIGADEFGNFDAHIYETMLPIIVR
jgi:hypothetical protein